MADSLNTQNIENIEKNLIFGSNEDLDNVKDCIDKMHKMAWEQVLLLAFYARKLFLDDTSGMRHRMKVIFEFNPYEVYEIIQILDSGAGSYEIASRDLNASHNKNKLINLFIQKGIVFPKIEKPFHYPHSCLFKVLSQPIACFNDLINLTCADDILSEVYKELAVDFQDESKKWNADKLKCEFKDRAFEKVYCEINEIFANFYPPKIDSKYLGPGVRELAQKCTFTQDDDDVFIAVPKDFIKKRVKTGNLGLLADELIDGLLSKIELSTHQPKDNKQYLSLSRWYEKNKTNFGQDVDDRPMLIASLIDFDLRNGVLGEVNNYINPAYKNLKNSESALAASSIISHCLYRAGKLSSFNIDVQDSEWAVPILPSEATRNNKMMKVYSGADIEKVLVNNEIKHHILETVSDDKVKIDVNILSKNIDKKISIAVKEAIRGRFRKARKRLDASFLSIDKDIQEQMEKTGRSKGSLNPQSPCPLWEL